MDQQCLQITKDGTQCLRKCGSSYCWQHQNEIKVNPELLQKSVQPGVLSNILTTAGYSSGINQQTNVMVHNLLPAIIKNWLKSINCQTDLNTIPEDQFPFLIQLYQTRVGDRPRSELIQQLVAQGFDQYIFYSKLYQFPVGKLDKTNLYDRKIDQEYFEESDYSIVKNMIEYEPYEIKSVEHIIKKYFDYTKLRKGDVLEIKFNPQDIHMKYVYDGTELWMSYDNGYSSSDYPPPEVPIQDFPLVDYFKVSYDSDKVQFKINTDDLVLIKEFYADDPNHICKYSTLDGYIIYFGGEEDPVKRYKDRKVIELDWESGDYIPTLRFVEPEDTDAIALYKDYQETIKETRLILFGKT